MPPEIHAASNPRIPPLTFYAIVSVFWIYASLTDIGHWQLMRQSLPRWGVPSLEEQVVELALLFPWLLGLCAWSWRSGHETGNWRRSVPRHILFAAIFGLASRPATIAAHALLQETSFLATEREFDGSDPMIFGRLYVSQAFNSVFQYLVLQVMLVGYTFYLRFSAEHRLRQTLALEFEKARLQALRMRINPHFLYNTLSAIAGLVPRDPDAAQRMVIRLGELFRRALADRDAEFIRLADEIALGEQYLQIQQLRFADRLSYDIDLPQELHEIAVPTLLLQPLLENSVEHGIGTTEARVLIMVRCERDAERAQITVSNSHGPGPIPATVSGFGIGLESTRERLRAAYGPEATLEAHSPAAGEYLVRLRFSPRP